MIVVKSPLNSKSFDPQLLNDPRNHAHALDAQLPSASSGRGNQNLDPYIGSNWRAFAADDQSPVHRHITCKAATGLLFAVVPVKEHRQPELEPKCSSTLRSAFKGRAWPHTYAEIKASREVAQVAVCLKIM